MPEQIVSEPSDESYLKIWCVYWNSADYPEKYVARLFHNEKRQHAIVVSEDLAIVRGQMEEFGLVPVPSNPSDDEMILESWV